MSTSTKRAPARKTGGGSSASKTFTFRGKKIVKPKEVPGDFALVPFEFDAMASDEDAGPMVALQYLYGELRKVLGAEELGKAKSTLKGPEDILNWAVELVNALVGSGEG